MEKRDTNLKRKGYICYGLGAVAAVLVVMAIVWKVTFNSPTHVARRHFAGALQEFREIKGMEAHLRVRTRPGEPIDCIDPACDFVPIALRVIYTEPLLWRVEKQGSGPMLYGVVDHRAVRPSSWIERGDSLMGGMEPYCGDVDGGLARMLDLRLLLDAECRLTQRDGVRYVIVDEGQKVTVRVQRDAPTNYLINTPLTEANTLREYTFDKATHRLLGVRIDVLDKGLTVTVLQSERMLFVGPLDRADIRHRNLTHSLFTQFDTLPDDRR